ncbi:hypothetical protein VVD49_01435 [Uliginosibacterium sp. H3]|uniref:Uncharacterized protein n=1 Tax=Uliginosibacterium silvisoli TaxID=3114758 RepID=A0ABU6JXK7_9RHOO|nr:hypothetical protein [Uliginosibacterium sp. H3]
MAPALIVVSAAFSIASIVLWLRLRAARRAEYIRSFTLPHGLFERLQKHHPQLTLKDCQLVSKGLRQFFLAYLKGGRQYVSMPSQVADDLWHEFILYTRNYQQFCRKAFGGFLHHTPAVALRSSKQGNAGLRRCWLHACRDELINPTNPTRLPLLFALDAKLAIVGGFQYEANCQGLKRQSVSGDSATPIYCAGDFSDTSIDGGIDGFDSFDSSDSSDGGGGDSSCGGGCGGD